MERRDLLKLSLPLGLIALTSRYWLDAFRAEPAEVLPELAMAGMDPVSGAEVTRAASQPALPSWFTKNRTHVHTRLTPERWESRPEFDALSDVVQEMGGTVITRHVKTAEEPVRLDLAREFAEDAHEKDLRVIAYYWHMTNAAVAAQHPEWVCHDVKGEPVLHKRGGMLDLTSPYRETVLRDLLGLAEQGVDGFYFDYRHLPPVGCFSTDLGEKFRKSTGRGIPRNSRANNEDFGALLDFQAEQIADTFRYWKEAVQAKHPGVVFLISVAALPALINRQLTTRLAAVADSAKTEFSATQRRGVNLNAFSGVRAQPEPREDLRIALGLVTVRDAADGRAPHVWSIGFPNGEHARAFAGGVIAWGGIANMDIRETDILGKSAASRAQREAIRSTLEMGAKAGAALTNTAPVRWLGIHFPEGWRNGFGGDVGRVARDVVWPMTGAFGVAADAGLPAGVVTDAQLATGQVGDYEVIFLPAPDGLSAQQQRVVAEFRARGKLVIEQDPDWKWHASSTASSSFAALLDRHAKRPQVRALNLPKGVHAIPYAAGDGKLVVAITNRFDWVEEKEVGGESRAETAAPPRAASGIILEFQDAPGRIVEAMTGQALTASGSGPQQVRVEPVETLSVVVANPA